MIAKKRTVRWSFPDGDEFDVAGAGVIHNLLSGGHGEFVEDLMYSGCAVDGEGESLLCIILILIFK